MWASRNVGLNAYADRTVTLCRQRTFCDIDKLSARRAALFAIERLWSCILATVDGLAVGFNYVHHDGLTANDTVF